MRDKQPVFISILVAAPIMFLLFFSNKFIGPNGDQKQQKPHPSNQVAPKHVIETLSVSHIIKNGKVHFYLAPSNKNIKSISLVISAPENNLIPQKKKFTLKKNQTFSELVFKVNPHLNNGKDQFVEIYSPKNPYFKRKIPLNLSSFNPPPIVKKRTVTSEPRSSNKDIGEEKYRKPLPKKEPIATKPKKKKQVVVKKNKAPSKKKPSLSNKTKKRPIVSKKKKKPRYSKAYRQLQRERKNLELQKMKMKNYQTQLENQKLELELEKQKVALEKLKLENERSLSSQETNIVKPEDIEIIENIKEEEAPISKEAGIHRRFLNNPYLEDNEKEDEKSAEPTKNVEKSKNYGQEVHSNAIRSMIGIRGSK